MPDRYQVIVADPPWPIRWSGGSVTAGAATGSKRVYPKRGLPYPTMPTEDIASLPVRDLAADDAHLFMWTLDRFLIDGSAASICRAWGFEPMPQTIVWAKASAGLGRFIRPAHEVVLIGRRGDARMAEVSTTSVHAWRQPYAGGAKVHSAKPEGFLDLVELLCPGGPYLELFARRQRIGWDTWGNQARCDVDLALAAAIEEADRG